MTPRDFKPLTGCDLTWKRAEKAADKNAKKVSTEEAIQEAEYARYIGTNDAKRCEMTSHAVMGLVSTEYRGEISANQVDLAELQYDSARKLSQGATADPFYRFRRQGK